MFKLKYKQLIYVICITITFLSYFSIFYMPIEYVTKVLDTPIVLLSFIININYLIFIVWILLLFIGIIQSYHITHCLISRILVWLLNASCIAMFLISSFALQLSTSSYDELHITDNYLFNERIVCSDRFMLGDHFGYIYICPPFIGIGRRTEHRWGGKDYADYNLPSEIWSAKRLNKMVYIETNGYFYIDDFTSSISLLVD